MLRVERIDCPSCGAPLSIPRGRDVVLCAYCNSSLRVVTEEDGGRTGVQRDPSVPPAVVEAAKQAILAGRRAEAIRDYARDTGLSRDEATKAVDQLMALAVLSRLAYGSLSLRGFLMLGGSLTLAGTLSVYAIAQLWIELTIGWGLAAAVGVLWFLSSFRSLVRHSIGTWVCAYGTRGRARVLHCAELKPIPDGSFLLVQLEVTPPGGAPFLHEQVYGIRTVSRSKVSVGNVIAVRIGLGQKLVFPAAPITVLESAGGAPARVAGA